MKKTIKPLITIMLLGAASLSAQEQRPCDDVKAAVGSQVSSSRESVLTIVSQAVSENEDCAGEIAAAAIAASNASNELVGQIVEVAGTIAPGQINVIARAAFVAAPGARAEIIAAAGKVAPGNFDVAIALPVQDVEFPSEVLNLPSAANLGGGNNTGEFAGSPNQEPEVVTNPNP
ncbi:hypothetical protein [Luteolibacter sp. AS25]|uniref:hypothetical protein n=1 Tax=Luteolibacter sp. AS25 TaxID=3135776 RepID=UPI00398B434F